MSGVDDRCYCCESRRRARAGGLVPGVKRGGSFATALDLTSRAFMALAAPANIAATWMPFMTVWLRAYTSACCCQVLERWIAQVMSFSGRGRGRAGCSPGPPSYAGSACSASCRRRPALASAALLPSACGWGTRRELHRLHQAVWSLSGRRWLERRVWLCMLR